MATTQGNDGQVLIGTATLAEVVDFSYTETAVTTPDSVLGDDWDTIKSGSKSWSGSVSCYWDATDAAGQETLVIGAEVALTLIPEGAAVGSILVSGTAVVTGVESATSRDAIVTANFTFQGNGALTKTAQAI